MLPDHILENAPELQLYLATTYLTESHFRRWDQAIQFKEPNSKWPLVKAAWYFVAGSALLEKREIQAATITVENLKGLAEEQQNNPLFNNTLALQISTFQKILAAQLYNAENQNELALENWQSAQKNLKQLPSYAKPLFKLHIMIGLGKQYMKLGKFAKAIKTTNQYLDENPGSAWAMRIVSNYYRKNNENKRAQRNYSDSVIAWRNADVPFSQVL